MPTYDYQCDACGHKFEEFQNITAPVLTKCPACKKKKLRRLFGIGAAVVFKGSGFYQTDYRSDGYKKAAEKDSHGDSWKSESSGAKDSGVAKDTSGAASTNEKSTSAKPADTKSTDNPSTKSESSTKPKTGKKKE
ncbi:MAG: zinc ribbon domain-containing protein [Pirellulaceae bacterium]|nr:zinc ribbon domain-containing protein [Pirellulaceae bacterium]